MLVKIVRILVSLALASAVAACGGGGGGGSGTVTQDLGDTAYWPFDSVAGNASPNTKFAGLDAVLNSATLVPGRVGNALQLDANLPQSYAEIPITPGGEIVVDFPGDDISVALWARPTQIGATATYILLGGGSGGQQSFHVRVVGGKVAFFLNKAPSIGTEDLIATSTTALTTATWTHIAVTFDGTVATIYLNGVVDATVVMPHRVEQVINRLYVGGRQLTTGTPDIFPGAIDELVLTQRVLTPAEIAQLVAGNPP